MGRTWRATPNQQDHRRRATDAQHGTAVLSRRSVHPLVRQLSYEMGEVFVRDHLRKLNSVQLLMVLLGEFLVACPHATKSLIYGRSQLQPLTHCRSPIIAAAKDPLNC